jgi:hypothetical protein
VAVNARSEVAITAHAIVLVMSFSRGPVEVVREPPG